MNAISGNVVIVTGASRGIGAATARHLASKGASVVLAARSGEAVGAIADEIVKAGGAASACACDVSKMDEVKALIDHACERFGKLDVLVNNAGLIDPIAHLADSDPEAWTHVVDVNLKGVYYGIRFAIPKMLEQGGGTIINLSSGAASSALAGWTHYSCTKAAVLSLTRCVDREYRDQGIRVLGLSPGTVATDMQVSIRASGINPVSQLDPSVHIPSEWVAKAIAYLCEPAADGYLGTDFSLKSNAGRAEAGLPPLS